MCGAVNPGEPELSVDTTEQDMREGRTVHFTCTSSGGNPAPSITWYRNSLPVTGAESTLTAPAVKFAATVATLTWTLTAADHLANFSCSAITHDIPASRVYSPVHYYHVQCKCCTLSALHTCTVFCVRYRDANLT